MLAHIIQIDRDIDAHIDARIALECRKTIEGHSGIRFGASVLSPMVPVGEADYLVVLDESQVEINRHVLSSGGCLITPEAIAGVELPNKRSLNVALLGVLSMHLDIGVDSWQAAIRSGFKESLHEVNLKAFDAGRAAGA